MSYATTAAPKPSSGHLGGWAMQWSTEEMLDGQYQKVGTPTHARTTHKGFLQKRLEKDLCCIIPHVPPPHPPTPTTQSAKKLNWTQVQEDELLFGLPAVFAWFVVLRTLLFTAVSAAFGLDSFSISFAVHLWCRCWSFAGAWWPLLRLAGWCGIHRTDFFLKRRKKMLSETVTMRAHYTHSKTKILFERQENEGKSMEKKSTLALKKSVYSWFNSIHKLYCPLKKYTKNDSFFFWHTVLSLLKKKNPPMNTTLNNKLHKITINIQCILILSEGHIHTHTTYSAHTHTHTHIAHIYAYTQTHWLTTECIMYTWAKTLKYSQGHCACVYGALIQLY